MKIINPPDKVIMQLTGSKVYDGKIKYRFLKWVGVIQVDEENESHLKIFGGFGHCGSSSINEQG